MGDPYNHDACLKSYRAIESERDKLRAEVERLKAELERTKELLIDAKRYGYMGKDSPMMLDRDRYKAVAEKIAKELGVEVSDLKASLEALVKR